MNVLQVRKPVTQSPKDPREQLRKRMKSLYNTILYYTNTDNIQPIGVFMELPDKKAYPDYYDIMNEPVDMKKINDKAGYLGEMGKEERVRMKKKKKKV